MDRKIWTAGLAISISGILLFFTVRNIEIRDVVRNIGSANLLQLFIALTLYLAHLGMRIVRWRVIIRPEKTVQFRNLISSLSVGFLVNNILPIRAGEVARAYVLARKEPVGWVYAFSTIVTERILDLFALVTFFLIALKTVHAPPWVERVAFLGSGVVIVAFSILGWVGYVKNGKRYRVFRWFPDDIVKGLHLFRNAKHVIILIISSLAIWATWGGFLYVTLSATGIHLNATAILFLVAVMNLALIFPSAPGFIGTYQFVCVSSLAIFNVDKEPAFAFSLISHVLWYVPTTLVGIYFLWKDHFHVGEVLKKITNRDEQERPK